MAHRSKQIFFAYTILVFSQIACANKINTKPVVSDSVAEYIGELIILSDRNRSYLYDDNPFGSATTFVRFEKLYSENVKQLSNTSRSDFFWAAMWHLNFDGDYMHQFQELAFKDLGDSFINRLTDYIEKEKVLSRDSGKLNLSEKVLNGLKRMRDRSRSK